MNKFIILIILFSFLGCNETFNKNKKQISEKNQYRDEQLLLDDLSEAMHSYNKVAIKNCWDSILNNKDSMIDYLMLFKGRKSISKWYWRDLKSSRIFARNYSMPSEEVAALFIICAIYHNDIAFAASRKMYDDEVLTIDGNNNFENINQSENVNLDKIWDKVSDWNINRNVGRPFSGTKIFWVGEDGGKINRSNIINTKWHFYG